MDAVLFQITLTSNFSLNTLLNLSYKYTLKQKIQKLAMQQQQQIWVEVSKKYIN